MPLLPPNIYSTVYSLSTLEGINIFRYLLLGSDGRFLGLHPGQDGLPKVELDTLVKNYALRYIVMGDLDFHNPGNILFARHSSLTPETLLNIDGEDVFPDSESMQNFLDTQWQDGEPIPGSTLWRQTMSEFHGRDKFFELQVDSENPLLMYLRELLSPEEIKGTSLVPFLWENSVCAHSTALHFFLKKDLEGGVTYR
tara:strand:- start:1176 stop:1766 length:591 start_codon:yes stop_codon:yes gene_type:complete